MCSTKITISTMIPVDGLTHPNMPFTTPTKHMTIQCKPWYLLGPRLAWNALKHAFGSSANWVVCNWNACHSYKTRSFYLPEGVNRRWLTRARTFRLFGICKHCFIFANELYTWNMIYGFYLVFIKRSKKNKERKHT